MRPYVHIQRGESALGNAPKIRLDPPGQGVLQKMSERQVSSFVTWSNLLGVEDKIDGDKIDTDTSFQYLRLNSEVS